MHFKNAEKAIIGKCKWKKKKTIYKPKKCFCTHHIFKAVNIIAFVLPHFYVDEFSFDYTIPI